jgi:hypothetical protein
MRTKTIGWFQGRTQLAGLKNENDEERVGWPVSRRMKNTILVRDLLNELGFNKKEEHDFGCLMYSARAYIGCIRNKGNLS